jgi:hypothetical protein
VKEDQVKKEITQALKVVKEVAEFSISVLGLFIT